MKKNYNDVIVEVATAHIYDFLNVGEAKEDAYFKSFLKILGI